MIVVFSIEVVVLKQPEFGAREAVLFNRSQKSIDVQDSREKHELIKRIVTEKAKIFVPNVVVGFFRPKLTVLLEFDVFHSILMSAYFGLVCDIDF